MHVSLNRAQYIPSESSVEADVLSVLLSVWLGVLVASNKAICLARIAVLRKNSARLICATLGELVLEASRCSSL